MVIGQLMLRESVVILLGALEGQGPDLTTLASSVGTPDLESQLQIGGASKLCIFGVHHPRVSNYQWTICTLL